MWTTIALVAAVIGLIYIFLTWNFDYWKKQGIKSPKPTLLGNFPNSFTQKQNFVYDIDELYRAHKQDEDFVGVFNFRSPQLLILNAELVHRVFVNDFKNFHDNEISTLVDNESDIIFGNNIFALTGEAWKEKRALLTPGLTMSRTKNVYPVTNKVCRKMRQYLKDHVKIAPKDGIEAKDLCLRFTSEVVTDCVLGLEANSFTENPTPILGMIKRLFSTTISFIIYFTIIGLFPIAKKFYKARIIQKDVAKFFVDLMQTAVDMRKSNPSQKSRNDFLNYLLQLQQKKNFTTIDLTTHTMTFLIDGFETTATVLSHCLLMLGRYPETQERLRTEILQNIDQDGIVEFEKLADLPYLDACIHEAIRLFPPALFSNKLCTEPIELTDKNGRSVKLEKGDIVALPLYSIMTDEVYYPNAKEFKPERFLAENGFTLKNYREKGIYYGFGDGPRICIGMRFALAQVKAGLVEIVTNFNIRVNPKTRKDDLMDPKAILGQLEGGVWLDLESRN